MKVFIMWMVFLPVLGFAASPAEDLQLKKQMSEKARAKAYDGGGDEQPLVVQQNLTEPRTDGSEYTLQRKILNTPEKAAGGEESAPTENNDETSSGF
ncbi:MAG: hypothetical protein AB7F59_11550 [Bdellovibrionales bacterium]